MIGLYWPAFKVALWQAIAAFMLAIASASLIVGRHGTGFAGDEADLIFGVSTNPWLDTLNRLTEADVAVVLVVLAVSMTSICENAEAIRKALHRANPTRFCTVSRQLTTLCGLAVFMCLVGLLSPPARLGDLAKRCDLWSSLIFLWPTALTIVLAFFSAVLIGAFEIRGREPR
jgi:hypothetical protein